MGIGSLFSSFLKKKEEDHQQVSELNLEPTRKERDKGNRQEVPQKAEPLSSRPEESGKDKAKAAVREEAPRAAAPKTTTVREASGNDRKPKKQGKPAARDGQSDEKKAWFQAKKDLYQYLNTAMKKLYQADQEDSWEKLSPFEGPSDKAAAVTGKVMEELPDREKELLMPFLDKELMQSPAGLKEAFYAMLLPFYGTYRHLFSEFRYNTFMNKDGLDLFRRLTGRKYRLGYRNRYASGQAAFEWKDDRYRVYDQKGTMLCDAVFKDGAIHEGYAVMAEEKADIGEWSVIRKGYYKEGSFTEDTIEYVYRRPVDIIR